MTDPDAVACPDCGHLPAFHPTTLCMEEDADD